MRASNYYSNVSDSLAVAVIVIRGPLPGQCAANANETKRRSSRHGAAGAGTFAARQDVSGS